MAVRRLFAALVTGFALALASSSAASAGDVKVRDSGLEHHDRLVFFV